MSRMTETSISPTQARQASIEANRDPPGLLGSDAHASDGVHSKRSTEMRVSWVSNGPRGATNIRRVCSIRINQHQMGSKYPHLHVGASQIEETPCHSSRGGAGDEPGGQQELYATLNLS